MLPKYFHHFSYFLKQQGQSKGLEVWKLHVQICNFSGYANSRKELVMTNNETRNQTGAFSMENTVLVISPNAQLIQDIKDFCESKNMKLFVGDPNSPDVIAVPSKVCIVEKDFMDKKSWNDWIGFLVDNKGEDVEQLLIVILPHSFSESLLEEVKQEFDGSDAPIQFMFGYDGTLVVELMKKFMDT